MTAPWGDARADRYWCLRDAGINLDGDGFLSDPAGSWGRAVNPHVATLDAVCDPRCVVIIGEPGAGKSETVRLHAPLLADMPAMPAMPVVSVDLAEYGTEDRLATALFAHPDVVAWRTAGTGDLCVVLDSLDECQERVSHIATVLGHELARWPTDRLYLRICCRTGDWPESLQQKLEQSFPEVHVFELLPLARAAVADLCTAAGVRAGEFLTAVRAARVGPLAAKPLTLEMLLRLYRRDGQLPGDVTGLYQDALLLLAEEPAQRRRDAQPAGRLSATDYIAVAARLAALSTFGHRAAFWTARPDERPDTDLALRDCAGGTEPGTAGPVAVSEDSIRETLRTGLFTSRGAARVGWAHHTFAEHLTARFLLVHRLHEKQARSLLVAADGQVYPQLRPVAAWLVALSPDGEYDWLVEQDPELLLTAPVEVPRPQVRERAVTGLFRLAAVGDYRHGFGHRFDGLAYPGLENVLRTQLRGGTPEQRGLALDLAGDCTLPALRGDLVTIVLDTTEEYRMRTSAAHALRTIADHVTTTELRPLAAAASGDDDVDDQLKGYALRLSWPHAMTTREVLDALTPPRRNNLLGAYAMFVQFELPEALSPADIDIGLDWLLAVERTGRRHHRFDRLADRIVMLALDAVDDTTVADRLAQLALLRGAAHEPLFVDRISRDDPKPELTPHQRHRITAAALQYVDPDETIQLVDYTAHGPGIVTGDDLAWLIDRFDAEPDRRDVLSRLVEWVFHPAIPGHGQLALDLPDDHPLRVGPLSDWLAPVALGSEQAQRARERQRMLQANAEPTPEQAPLSDAEVEQKIGAWLDRLDEGDPAGFWQACVFLYLPPGARAVQGDEFDPDVTAQPRWAVLPDDLRNRLLAAARRYVDIGDCAPDAWLGTGTLHRPAYAGYRALILLRRLDPCALDTIPATVWRRWAPIILAAYTAHGAGKWEEKLALLDLTSAHAAEELFAAAVALIESDSSRGEPIYHDREVAQIWSPQLARWLREAITAGRLHERTAADATTLLAEHDPEGARQLLQAILTEDGEPQRRAHAAALLLGHDAQPSWPALYTVLQDHPDLAERMVCELYRESPPALAEGDLADLYVWLVRQFPFAEDPVFDHVHAVGPREQIAHWRDSILRTLQKHGTPAAVNAIARIEAALPHHPWLRTIRRDAELVLRRNTWQPVAPQALLDLVVSPDRRLVATTADLLDAVLDALSAIQTRLTGETPESHLLWDTRSGRPKPEEEISDYLRNRLHDLLVDRRVVVSREVQVRRMGPGIGERTDLRIDAVHADTATVTPLTVVLEVKGAWNRDLRADLRGQLVDRYMKDIGTAHGVYLIAWPDLDSWEPANAAKRRVAPRYDSTTRKDLEMQAAALATDGTYVRVVHLDIARTRPAPSRPSAR